MHLLLVDRSTPQSPQRASPQDASRWPRNSNVFIALSSTSARPLDPSVMFGLRVVPGVY
jgi:hypothetical protein